MVRNEIANSSSSSSMYRGSLHSRSSSPASIDCSHAECDGNRVDRIRGWAVVADNSDESSSSSSESSFADMSFSSIDYDSDDEDEFGLDTQTFTVSPQPSSLTPRAVPESKQPTQKKLRFGTITVREYAVTVGSRSATSGQCPLQLSWEHAPDKVSSWSELDPAEAAVPHQKRKIARPLTVCQRRRRIAAVQGLDVKQVWQLEYDSVLQHIEDALYSAGEA